MKRILLTTAVVALAPLAMFHGCAIEDATPSNTGGTSGATTGSASGAAGATSGAGGASGTAGSTTTSGTGGAGGSIVTGGTGGSGGATTTTTTTTTGTGGAGGAAGATGGSAGATGGSAGTTGGSAGATADAGGAGAPGDAGEGGVAGACGAVSTQACIDSIAGLKSNLNFMWKDSWMITGCQSKSNHDCITMPTCPTNPVFEDSGALIKELFPLGGEMGRTYAITFKFNAVAEAKYYTGGTPPPAPTNIDTAILDTFHIGGTAVPSPYNVMRVRVLGPTNMEVGRYYLNSFPQASAAESHRTFLIGFQKTIDVPGRGFVEFQVADSNCHAIDNCNPGVVSGTTCAAARVIPNEPGLMLPALYPDPSNPTVPIPIAMMNSRTGNMQPWHAQAGHWTVIGAVLKP